MHFRYFDLLSGEPVLVQGVGHLRSPQLKNIYPLSGVGYDGYNLYRAFLSWDKEQVLKYDKLFNFRGVDRVEANAESLSAFDVVTLLPPTRALCIEVMSFFMVENVVWDEDNRKFVAYLTDDDGQHVSGEINRSNFEEVRNMMLQLNYINLEKDVVEPHHTSEEARRLWEKAQGFLRKQAEKESGEDKPEYHLSNIVSKICASHPSYNLLNIGELTIFQLYDTFFQFGYMRSIQLSERIFSNHGGDKFNFNDWLKPISKNI